MIESSDNSQDAHGADKSSRRDFIKSSSFIMAGGAVTGSLSVPDNVHAGVGVHGGASETIRVGLIGCGQRGTAAAVQALNDPGENKVHLVAMADSFADRIHASLRGIKGSLSGHRDESPLASLVDVPPQRQFVGLDAYARLLELELDLVILAAPPVFRPQHFEASTNAGIHVLMETPVAVDSVGVRRVIAAGQLASEKKLVVAVGLQRRYEPRYVETVQRVQEGDIGEILFARAYWNGGGRRISTRSNKQTEMEYQLRNWRGFHWLSGDLIVEQHVHNLDVINWVKGAYPISCQGQGGRHGAGGMQGGDNFDHHMVEYTYADGSKLLSQCRHVPGCWPSVAEHAHGTRGTANLANASIYDLSGQRLWKYGTGGGGGRQRQIAALLRAICQRDSLNEVEYGALSTLTAIMGRMATYSGQVIHWEDAYETEFGLVPATLALDAEPPVLPDDAGIYPVAVPGSTPIV